MATKVSQWLLKTNAFDLMDKVAGAFKKVNAATDAATAGYDKMTGGVKKLTSTITELETHLGSLKDKKKLAFDETEILQLNNEIRKTEAELRRLDNLQAKPSGKGWFSGMLENGPAQLGKIAAGLGLVIGLSQGLEFGKDIVAATAKYQKFGAILQNALGKEEATKSLTQLSEFATKTPFQLDELTGSYIKLVNRGMKPSTDAMTKMGDLASSQGKTFDQLTEAVLDATTGEFERLKEFGIRGSKAGDQVTLSFKGLTQQVANTPTEINKALLLFGKMNGVAGVMDSVSKTIEGRLSNLGDRYDQLKVRIGVAFISGLEKGFDFLEGLMTSLDGLAAWMERNRAGVGLFFKIVGAGIVVMSGFALATWAATLPLNIWVFAAAAVVGALLYLYNNFALVRGVIDGFIETVKIYIEIMYGWGKIIFGIFDGIFKMFQGDFSFSNFSDAVISEFDTMVKAGNRIGTAFSNGMKEGIKDNAKDTRGAMEKLMDTIPGGGGAANQFLTGDTNQQQGDSTMTQAVTNITNQDQGQKNYVINIANLIGIGSYTDNSGKPRRAAERAGDTMLDELTRALNGANLAVQ